MMNTNRRSALPQIGNQSRRDWIARVLQAAGASVLMLPASANMESSKQSAAWRPQFFSDEQNAALVSLGEDIVPGSAAAGCNRIIDLVLSIESDKTKHEMLAALAAFDHQAQTQYGKTFRQLSPQERTAVLNIASEQGQALYGEFGVVKEWITDAYWSSEQGMRELGWSGRVAWASFPGCPHEGEHPRDNA